MSIHSNTKHTKMYHDAASRWKKVLTWATYSFSALVYYSNVASENATDYSTTPCFLSEKYRNVKHYPALFDVYSFGCVVWIITKQCNGCTPLYSTISYSLQLCIYCPHDPTYYHQRPPQVLLVKSANRRLPSGIKALSFPALKQLCFWEPPLITYQPIKMSHRGPEVSS